MRWIVEAGDSTIGPVGFVVEGLTADTKEAALKQLRESYAVLPEMTELKGEDEDGNPLVVRVYFNADALTVDNIEEDGGNAERCTCGYDGGPVVLHGSADASCPKCGGDWPQRE